MGEARVSIQCSKGEATEGEELRNIKEAEPREKVGGYSACLQQAV